MAFSDKDLKANHNALELKEAMFKELKYDDNNSTKRISIRGGNYDKETNEILK